MTATLALPDLSHLSPDELAAVDDLLAPDATAVLSFREYVDRVKPEYIWYRHAEQIAGVLQRVADGELTRVIFLAPPRTGKSEPISRLFPGYWLYRNPEQWVGLTSYGANLARGMSRKAREYYQRLGKELSVAAVDHWETMQGGGMWAAGFGGTILGKGGHLMLVDDPLKNSAEAASETIAERNKDFWASTFRNRVEPGGAIVIILQRWPGVADLVSYLYELEAGENPERWHVVPLDAEHDPSAWDEIPSTCTIEPDWRQAGDLLCPERLPAHELRKIRQQEGEYYFSAQYQQRPRPRDGIMFPPGKVTYVDAVPANVRWCRYWDKAATEGGGCATAGVRMGYADGTFYISDVRRGHWGADQRKREMRNTAESDGQSVRVKVEQEPGSGGKESAEDDVKLLAGFAVSVDRVTGDKVIRADPFAAQWQAGNVRIVRQQGASGTWALGAWVKPFLQECEAFPHGKFKDQVDAAAGACNELALRPQLLVA